MAASESTALLAKAHGGTHGHEHVKVTTLECFFDLSFVVIVHGLASPIKDAEEITLKAFLQSGVTIYCLWIIWCLTSEYIIDVRLSTGKIKPFDLLVTILVMFFQSLMGVASNEHSKFKFLAAFWIASIIVPLAYQILPYRSNFKKETARLFLFHFPMLAAFCIPPIFIPQDVNTECWAVCMACYQLTLTCLQVSFDAQDSDGLTEESTVQKKELWAERYELVILIGLGEILEAFINDYRSDDQLALKIGLSGFLTAWALYFLYFAVIPNNWKRASDESGRWNSLTLMSHYFIVFSSACFGCAYSRILEHIKPTGQESSLLQAHGDPHGSAHKDPHGSANAHQFTDTKLILSIALALFLVASGMYIALGIGDDHRVRLSHKVTGCIRMLVGFGLPLGLYWIDMSSGTLAAIGPTCLLSLAIFEAWAAGTTQGDIKLSLFDELDSAGDARV